MNMRRQAFVNFFVSQYHCGYNILLQRSKVLKALIGKNQPVMTSNKNIIFWTFVMVSIAIVFISCEKNSPSDVSRETPANSDIEYWLTTGNKTTLFQKIAEPIVFREETSGMSVITVDTTQQFQSIDGFGYSLTGGSAYLLHEKLTTSQRNELLRELFSTNDAGIGVSYLRISIGASDLDDHVFSYNDLPSGERSEEHTSELQSPCNLVCRLLL